MINQVQINITGQGPALPPAITSITPLQARSGDVLTIEGANFHSGIIVSIGGFQATEVSFENLPSSIAVTIPEGIPPGAVAVTVISPGVGSSAGVTLEILPPPTLFVRGDVDFSGNIAMTDPIQVLLWLFRGGELSCRDAGDVDDNGQVNLTDAIGLLTWLFRGGAPHANGEECVRIPTCPESCSD